jgi:hypothetical protein
MITKAIKKMPVVGDWVVYDMKPERIESINKTRVTFVSGKKTTTNHLYWLSTDVQAMRKMKIRNFLNS